MKEAQQKERQLISDFAALVEEHVADTAAPLGQAQLALEQVRRYRVMQYAFRGTSHVRTAVWLWGSRVASTTPGPHHAMRWRSCTPGTRRVLPSSKRSSSPVNRLLQAQQLREQARTARPAAGLEAQAAELDKKTAALQAERRAAAQQLADVQAENAALQRLVDEQRAANRRRQAAQEQARLKRTS